MRKQTFAALFISSALLLTTVPASFAARAPSTNGDPKISEDSPTGYYIWRDDGAFHLRTHGPRAQHDFDAVLRTKGTFENVDAVRLEGDDRIDVLDGGHKLVVHFHTFDSTDGVNFTVRDGERLRFNLKIDDKQAPTSEIFLGARHRHPKKDPFSVRLKG